MSVFDVRRLVPGESVRVRLVDGSVPAGWPSPAEDYFDGTIDLNTHLMPHPAATFVVRVQGWSMRDAGISDGDEVIVDRSLTARHGHVVIAVIDSDFVIKRLMLEGARAPRLASAHPDHPDIPITGEVTIWGVVTHCLHKMVREYPRSRPGRSSA